jgi:predicted DNA-binding protein (MmcQ/YjbR family)
MVTAERFSGRNAIPMSISKGGRPHPAMERLREHALGYPEVREDFPWGHSAFKVKGKTFVFLASDAGTLSLSVKLPQSGPAALDRPFAEPTHYGLGRSGWVTATFAPDESPPLELLRAWIRESFLAIAPKKVAASLTGPGPAARASSSSPPRPRRTRAPRRSKP